jgi:putative endonuclease
MTTAMNDRAALGRWGEEIAVGHLRRSGYQILDRNVRTKLGEIDIVAKQGDCLVIVEVRTRRSSAMTPEESVGPIKQRRLARLGELYLATHSSADVDWRTDVIAIEQSGAGKVARLEHVVNAVELYP